MLELAVERGPLALDVVRLAAPTAARAVAASGSGRGETGGRDGPTPAGRVLDPGRDGEGRRDGVRVVVDEPAWLVLGESFNAGWRASCDGRDLGRPRVIDAYANGWPVEPGCRDVSFAYAPNGRARWAYALSALGVLAILVALGVGGCRRRATRASAAGARPPSGPERSSRLPARDRASPLELRRSLLAAGAIAPAAMLLFSIRAGVAIAIAVAIVLWRGIGARALALAAGGLLAVALPAVQLGWLPEDRGGFNGRYAADVMAAHWVGVAAWALLALALWRALSATGRGGLRTATRSPDDRAAGPAGAGGRRGRP
jgi:hypothetical protein